MRNCLKASAIKDLQELLTQNTSVTHFELLGKLPTERVRDTKKTKVGIPLIGASLDPQKIPAKME